MDTFAETRFLCGFMGWHLPIRYEAMHIECEKYAAPKEIFRRVVLLDAEFLKYEEAKRKKQEEETKRRHVRH